MRQVHQNHIIFGLNIFGADEKQQPGTAKRFDNDTFIQRRFFACLILLLIWFTSFCFDFLSLMMFIVCDRLAVESEQIIHLSTNVQSLGNSCTDELAAPSR